MTIRINEALRAYTDPLTQTEYTALENSLLADGCRDALVLWDDMLVDGHNRYAICQKHGIEFKTMQHGGFASIEDVQLWMIDNHLARRSVSDFQRGMLALRKKDILGARNKPQSAQANETPSDQAEAPAVPRQSREDVAREARVSSNTLSQIEKIQKSAAPALVEAVRTGAISINAAAAVASLPDSEQVAAVAGGRKEMQQAARQVREGKTAARPRAVDAERPASAAIDEVTLLKQRVITLTEENHALRAQLAALNAGHA
jgi:hypothetical protein